MTSLTSIVDEFRCILGNHSKQIEKYCPFNYEGEHVWQNWYYANHQIRYGHLEYFQSSNQGITVLHCVLFPHYSLDCGIFGFDLIALNGNITGIFCDITYSKERNTFLSQLYADVQSYQRKLPEWAGFFSPDFIFISLPENFDSFLNSIYKLLSEYLLQDCYTNYNPFCIRQNIDNQDQYSLKQRQNPKTLGALSAFIGKDKAKEFVDKVLFPTSF